MEERIGNKLKQARQSKGYTLDDLQQITKIQKKYLIAIEEGEYDIMPGEFYTKAFIKQIADTVGLDGETAVIDYLTEKDAPVVAPIEPETVTVTPTPQVTPEKSVQQEPKTETAMPSRQDVKPTSQVAVDKTVGQIKRYIPTVLIAMLVLATIIAMFKAFKDGNTTPKPVIESNSSLVESSQSESSVESSESAKEESSEIESSEKIEESTESQASNESSEETSDDVQTSQQTSNEEATTPQQPAVQGTVTNIGYDSETVNYSVKGITYPVEVVITNNGEMDLWSKITLDDQEVVDDIFSSGATFNAIANEGTGVINIEFGYRPTGDIYVNGIRVELPYGTNTTDVNFYLN